MCSSHPMSFRFPMSGNIYQGTKHKVENRSYQAHKSVQNNVLYLKVHVVPTQ